MVNRHNLTQLSSIDYHRFIFEAQGPKPVNRIFLGRKPKQPPQHVPGGYEVGHFWTFFGVATLSPHVMLAEKHVLGLADLVVIAPGVLFTARFLSTASSAVSWN